MAPSTLQSVTALALLGSVSALDVATVVDRLNSNPNDYAVYTADGPLGHIPMEEFARTMLLPPRPAPVGDDYKAHHTFVPSSRDVPSSYDWRDEGAVSAVKNQGSVGTCWAFSTAGCIEGQLAIQHAKLTNLSVEQLVECDNSSLDDAADCGMFGGWPYLAFDFVKEAGGMYEDSAWPYCVSVQRKSDLTQCWPCMASGYSIAGCGSHADMYCNASSTQGQGAQGLCKTADGAVVQVASWEAISSDESEIASALVEKGPLSVLLNAQMLQYYKSGIYNPNYCNPTSLDHAVLLVGYGTDDGVDYWTVKNSWGDSWGEDGYFRIVRGQGTCGINTAVTVASVV